MSKCLETLFALANESSEKEAEVKRLREDNERLRGLLGECQDYVEAGMSAVDQGLCDRVAREVSDE